MKRTFRIPATIYIEAEQVFEDGPTYINSISINNYDVRYDLFSAFGAYLKEMAETMLTEAFRAKRKEKHHELDETAP